MKENVSMKNFLNLKQPWEQVKEKLKENDVTLSDEDLQYEPGQEDAFLQRLGKKLNKNPDEVKRLIESVASNTAKAG